MLATTSEMTMTALARNTARSRPGKGSPPGSASGRVRMPARVMAPRTPASEVARIRRLRGMMPARPWRRAAAMDSRSETQTHTRRSTISPKLIASACPASHQKSRGTARSGPFTAARTMSGNCSPSSTNITPLSANCTVSQTTLRRTRVVASARPLSST